MPSLLPSESVQAAVQGGETRQSGGDGTESPGGPTHVELTGLDVGEEKAAETEKLRVLQKVPLKHSAKYL